MGTFTDRLFLILSGTLLTIIVALLIYAILFLSNNFLKALMPVQEAVPAKQFDLEGYQNLNISPDAGVQ